MPYMDFHEAVRAAIKDELEAGAMYMELSRLAMNAAFRARIRCFSAEERRHARILGTFLPEGAPDMPGAGPDDFDVADDAENSADLSWGSAPPCHPPFPPGQLPMQPPHMPPLPETPATGPSGAGAFAGGVASAIRGEVHAIEEYSVLAALAPTAGTRERILCIQKDEMYHLVSFEFIQSIIRGM